MCDYSLTSLPNRLASDREELVVYQFATGSMGFISLADLARRVEAIEGRSLWQRVKDSMRQNEHCRIPAVRVPPAALLPENHVWRPTEVVTHFRLKSSKFMMSFFSRSTSAGIHCLLLEDNEKQRIIAMVCSDPPEGFARWTVRLVAEEGLESPHEPRPGQNQLGFRPQSRPA